MSDASDYIERRRLAFWLNGVALPSVPNVWVALFTVAPNEDGTGGTEVSGGGYARAQVLPAGPNAGRFSTLANGSSPFAFVATVQNDVVFPDSTAAWGDIVEAWLVDASSGGNLMYRLVVASAPVTIPSNAEVSIVAGELTVVET